jgi:hypothetical protein
LAVERVEFTVMLRILLDRMVDLVAVVERMAEIVQVVKAFILEAHLLMLLVKVMTVDWDLKMEVSLLGEVVVQMPQVQMEADQMVEMAEMD